MVSLLFIGIVSNTYAEETLIFLEPDKVYETIQERNQCNQLLNKETEKYGALAEQMFLLEEQMAVQEQQCINIKEHMKILDDLSIRQTRALQDMQQLMELQKKGYEDIIKTSKPSFWEEVKKGATYILIGIGFGIGIIAL